MSEHFVRWMSSQVDRRGISFREVERQTGIASSTISAWLNGRTEPTAYSIERLAKFFDVEPREIYELLGRVEPVEIIELDETEMRLIQGYRSLGSAQRRLFARLAEAMIGYETEDTQAQQRQATQRSVQP